MGDIVKEQTNKPSEVDQLVARGQEALAAFGNFDQDQINYIVKRHRWQH